MLPKNFLWGGAVAAHQREEPGAGARRAALAHAAAGVAAKPAEVAVAVVFDLRLAAIADGGEDVDSRGDDKQHAGADDPGEDLPVGVGEQFRRARGPEKDVREHGLGLLS